MSFLEKAEQTLDFEDIPCLQNASSIDVSQYFRSNEYLEIPETKEDIYKKLQKYKQGSQKLINERRLLKNLIVEQEQQIKSAKEQIEQYKQKVQQQLEEIQDLKLMSSYKIQMEDDQEKNTKEEIKIMDLNLSWNTEQLQNVQMNDKQLVSDQFLQFLDKLDSVQQNRDQEFLKRDSIIQNKYEELNKKHQEIFNKEINDLNNKVIKKNQKISLLKLQIQQNQQANKQNDIMVEQINTHKQAYELLKGKYRKLKQCQQNKQNQLYDEIIEGIKKEYQDLNKRFLPGVMTEYIQFLNQKQQEVQNKCDQQINEIKAVNNELESINFETRKLFNKNFDIQIFREIKEDINQKIQEQNQMSFKYKEILKQQENEFQQKIDNYEKQRQQYKQEQQLLVQQKQQEILSREQQIQVLQIKNEEISQQIIKAHEDMEISKENEQLFLQNEQSYKENQQFQEEQLQAYDNYFDFVMQKFQFNEKQKQKKIGIQEGPLLPLMLDCIQNQQNNANLNKQVYYPHKYKLFQINYDADKLKNIAQFQHPPNFEQVIWIQDNNINYLWNLSVNPDKQTNNFSGYIIKNDKQNIITQNQINISFVREQNFINYPNNNELQELYVQFGNQLLFQFFMDSFNQLLEQNKLEYPKLHIPNVCFIQNLSNQKYFYIEEIQSQTKGNTQNQILYINSLKYYSYHITEGFYMITDMHIYGNCIHDTIVSSKIRFLCYYDQGNEEIIKQSQQLSPQNYDHGIYQQIMTNLNV